MDMIDEYLEDCYLRLTSFNMCYTSAFIVLYLHLALFCFCFSYVGRLASYITLNTNLYLPSPQLYFRPGMNLSLKGD